DDTPPPTWKLGQPFEHVEIAPGRIELLGGAPGTGKTVLLMQWVFSALFLNPDLRILVCNVEMPPGMLLNRQLSRLSVVPLTDILKQRIAPDDYAGIGRAVVTIRSVIGRLGFVKAPHNLDRVAEAADDFGADLIVLDYLQRIDPACPGSGERRERVT